MRRIKITLLALVAVLAIMGVSASGASASITCRKLTDEHTISDCTPSAGAGYTTLNEEYGECNPTSCEDVWSWSPGGATMTMKVTETYEGQGRCPAQNPARKPWYGKSDSEVVVSGIVVAASTFGLGIPAIGEEVGWAYCVRYINNVRGSVVSVKSGLVKGTRIEL